MDTRKESILRAVIFEYVANSEPIASEALAQKYELGVKSATIRSELADLAGLGYLEQPHTSAGRVPSDRGYRYYVDRLIVVQSPTADERQAVLRTSSEGEALQELLDGTARMLSRMTQMMAAAATVQSPRLSIKGAVVSALGPRQALCVLVLDNGRVESRMMEVEADLDLTDIAKANEHLNQQVVGQTLRSTARAKPPAVPGSPGLESLLAHVWVAVKSVSKELNRSSVTVRGEEFLLHQPEFQRDAGLLREVLDALSSQETLAEALSAPAEGAQKVSIGREHRREEYHPLSMVRQTFFVGSQEAGVIAIIGPRRMRYDQGIPLVNYTAAALTDALTKYLGGPTQKTL